VKKTILLVVGVILALAESPAFGQDDPQYVPGVWHYRSVACTDTTVRSVQPRLVSDGQKTYSRSDFEQSGVSVTFNTKLGADPAEPSVVAGVTHYQNTPGNDIMMSERSGDHVQVCFLGGPAPTKYCDPDKDGRGRLYRIYDYRQHAQYWGQNGEHDCGGA